MNVALISEHASPLSVLGGVDAGGQNVHVGELARALARRGIAVTVYTRRDDASLPPRVPFAPGVVVEHVAAGPARQVPKDELLPHMDAFAAALHRAWRKQPPHLVHAHFWMSGYAALRAAAGLRIPVVQTFHALGTVKRRHQGSADTSAPERLRIERSIAAEARGIIATCIDERRELEAMGAPVRRIRIVPCGVDLRRFRPDGAAMARKPGVRLLALGRLVPRKGIDDVLRALPGVPDAELIVAGGPAARELDADAEVLRLRAVAEQLGVGARVHFIGRVAREAVPRLLRSADVVVCTPWYEPFGIVPVEAMACGVPVVATAVGGMLDTVIEGVTGIFVPPRNPQRLGMALQRLAGDARLRARLGAAGAVRAHSRFGWQHVALNTLAAYRSLAGLSPEPVLAPWRTRRLPAPIQAALG